MHGDAGPIRTGFHELLQGIAQAEPLRFLERALRAPQQPPGSIHQEAIDVFVVRDAQRLAL